MAETALSIALRLDGKGGAEPITLATAVSRPEPGKVLWLHFDYTHPDTRRWLESESGLNEVVIAALLADETRPRSLSLDRGLLATLRGINHNRNAEPEDMVSIRLWVQEGLIITTFRRRLNTVMEIAEALSAGGGPTDEAGFVVSLCSGLTGHMAETMEDIEEQLDDLDERLLGNSEEKSLQHELGELRRRIIILRRYIAPQREALQRIVHEFTWLLPEAQRLQLRESTDQLTRYVEELDLSRDRATVIQEQLIAKASEELNRRLFLLAVITLVFLPLSFITGLLGVNVSGIPGAESPRAFFALSGMLGLILLLQIFWLKRSRWL